MPTLSDIETLKATGASNAPQQTGELSNEAITRKSNLIVFGAVGATAILLANKKTRKLGYLALAGLGLATVMILKSY
jgi:uncharacterized membrane protein YebE (DUF533 family)